MIRGFGWIDQSGNQTGRSTRKTLSHGGKLTSDSDPALPNYFKIYNLQFVNFSIEFLQV
jgi:hypothetical protein